MNQQATSETTVRLTVAQAPSDLVVAAQHGIDITVVISDNGGMMSIRRIEQIVTQHPYANVFERRDLAKRTLDGESLGLDYCSISRGMGAHAVRATTREELRAAFTDARLRPGVSVIVVPNDPNRFLSRGEVWWDVAPSEIDSQGNVTDARRRYEAGREAQTAFAGLELP